MIDFLFFVKTFCLTIALVLAMQVEVGNKTIENHAMSWMQSSMIVTPLNTVARGGAKLARDLTGYVSGKVKNNTKNVDNKKEEKKSSSFRWLSN